MTKKRVEPPAELDRHTIAVLQRAVKRMFPVLEDGELVLYCIRCLKSNYEVDLMIYDPFFTVCDECIDNLATFMRHLRAQKQRHTQAQSGSDEGEGEVGGESEAPTVG